MVGRTRVTTTTVVENEGFDEAPEFDFEDDGEEVEDDDDGAGDEGDEGDDTEN